MSSINQLEGPAAGRESATRGHDPFTSGGVIVVAGPDGAGKSTFCDAFVAQVLVDRPVHRIHFRPGILPHATRHEGPVTDPHAQSPYGRPLAAVKTVYTYADFALGWLLLFRRFTRAGGWIVVERGWWDQIVDPLRYRLPNDPPMVRLLGRLLPAAQITFVLEAPANILQLRKTELSSDETARQSGAWHHAVPDRVRRAYLDARRPVDELAQAAAAELARVTEDPVSAGQARLISLPPGRSARWLLPTSSRPIAGGALRVYHPVTFRARIGWELARAMAATGVLRLVSSVSKVTPAMSAVQRHVDDVAGVAVSGTNHSGRYIALGVKRDGEPRAVVKFASDPRGWTALERERVAIAYLGRRLAAPLSAPEVLGHEDGVLVLAPARWRPRLRPWRLPQDVAMAIGALFASEDGSTEARVGPAHGDFAPWNLLRTDRGWVLIDWEDVREDAPAFYDLFHYLVQSHVLLGRPSARTIKAGLRGKGWVGRAIAAYAHGAGLAPTEARAFFRIYLEESARAFNSSAPKSVMAFSARRRLMALTEDGWE